MTRAVMEKVDRHYEKGVRDLAAGVATKALEGVDEVDYVIVASSLSYLQEPQLDLGAHLASSLGLRGSRAVNVEAGEASGLAAADVAAALLRGKASRVLVVGVDKLTNFTSSETYAHLSLLYDDSISAYSSGLGSIAGILMRLYMERYGVDRLTMAHWPALMHSNAKHNPYAMLRFAVAPEKVLEAMPMADPITLMDSFPLGDGAAAVLLESRPRDALAELVAVESAVGPASIAWSEDPLFIESLAHAFHRLSQRHEVGDVDLVELHDSFTITALMVLESMGLAERGKAAEAVASGRFSPNGDLPVNLSGGLKARGHPIGATGVYQLAEVALQLAGSFPGLKVEGARKGLAVSVNGFGSSAYVAYLRGVA
ncbi:MAG: thiolase family protein [Acidilobaceae archaeon]